MIRELVRISLLIVGALFPIVNSPQNSANFLSLTASLSTEGRAVLVRKIAVNGFAILLVSVLIGTHILSAPRHLGAGGPGGRRPTSPHCSRMEAVERAPHLHRKRRKPPIYLTRRASYPLTPPLTVGPRSMSIAITVGANRPPGSEPR